MSVLAQERSDSSRHVNVLFLPLHSIQWASSRYRVYYYAERLKSYGISPRILHPNASTLTAKVVYLARIIMSLFWADVVVIQKKIFRRPLAWLIQCLHGLTIFDFDDAIYVYDDVQKRLPDVLRASHHVIVGNAHLERYARQYSSYVTRIPSPVDCERFSPKPTKRSTADVVTIGWIGQGGNQMYLDQLEPVFARLFQLKGNSVRLNVISNKLNEVYAATLPNPVCETETLFIRGSKSQYIMPEDEASIARTFPNSSVLTIEDAGHWVHADKPQEVFQLVTKFVNG